jgi:hypothetical protein
VSERRLAISAKWVLIHGAASAVWEGTAPRLAATVPRLFPCKIILHGSSSATPDASGRVALGLVPGEGLSSSPLPF